MLHAIHLLLVNNNCMSAKTLDGIKHLSVHLGSMLSSSRAIKNIKTNNLLLVDKNVYLLKLESDGAS